MAGLVANAPERLIFMSYVEIRQMCKRYGDTPVFEGINCTIERGELVTLLGPSGCGKSTLLRCIAGLTEPDSGSLSVDGQDITKTVPQQRGIGMVFQNYALFPNMTVQQNIAFSLKMHCCAPDEISRRVSQAIELVELVGKEKRYPSALSGGQRQRVALARALVMRPRILLLDEPLSALDAPIRKSLRGQIRDIQQQLGLTTLFVTHDQEEALQMSDRIFVMNKGSILQMGSAEDVYTRPANALVAGFMGNYNLLSAEQARHLFAYNGTEQIALRPEAIVMTSQAGNGSLQASVLKHQLLGNVIRYHLDVKGVCLWVDRLNRRSSDLLPAGTSVHVHISEQDWTAVQ